MNRRYACAEPTSVPASSVSAPSDPAFPPIYADAAAAVPPYDAAMREFDRVSREFWQNPSSRTGGGKRAAACLARAREECAALLGCHADELYFTSGGTEGINWAIRAALSLGQGKLVTSAMEHPASAHCAERESALGRQVVFLSPEENGRISPHAVENELAARNTALLSVMAANNETGVLQPVEELSALAAHYGTLFFSDGVQLPGSVPVSPRALGCDMMAFSGHKFGAPRGCGLLFVRRGTPLPPLLLGGGQENGKRAGTQNVAAAASMAVALRESLAACAAQDALSALRDRFEREMLRAFPHTCRIYGADAPRLPGFSCLSFDGAPGEALTLLLDLNGISVSVGSACRLGGTAPSPVLLSMGVPASDALGAVRFSFSYRNTPSELDSLVSRLPALVSRLRSLT